MKEFNSTQIEMLEEYLTNEDLYTSFRIGNGFYSTCEVDDLRIDISDWLNVGEYDTDLTWMVSMLDELTDYYIRYKDKESELETKLLILGIPSVRGKEDKDIVEEELWDHYSELPNPLWYEYKDKDNTE